MNAQPPSPTGALGPIAASAPVGMPPETKRIRRVLEPIDRVSEVLFALIMVLTFTGSLSIAADRDEVRTMLIGALGCNLAWGVIDAVLYLMGCFAERGAALRTLRAVRTSASAAEAHGFIAGALPPVLAPLLDPPDYEKLRERLTLLPEPPASARLQRNDWLGGLAVFLRVFLTTFPVVIPFLLMQDARLALRTSHAVAIVMLFVTGYAYGRCAGRHPWLTGIAMLVLGLALVALTIALGG